MPLSKKTLRHPRPAQSSPDSGFALSPEWKAEIDRRWHDVESGKVAVRDAEEVFSDALANVAETITEAAVKEIPPCNRYTTVELCAGGGGQALGLEQAGFRHLACVEYEEDFCRTLHYNRPVWNVICQDIREFDGSPYAGCDLLAGGVPCPPFSIAGKQLGENDERDMFPAALRLVGQIRPRAVMLENVKGLMTEKFSAYRRKIVRSLESLGYVVQYRLLEAADFGVPQLRPRFVLVALKERDASSFSWPEPADHRASVGEALFDLYSACGWKGAERLRELASGVAPTIVGGSKKHGGPDLGPTRARRAWADLGIDGRGLANEAPGPDFPADEKPRLTVRMAARLQGFPDSWQFSGGKTIQYRQIGNAFPPPVAKAVAGKIREAFERTDSDA